MLSSFDAHLRTAPHGRFRGDYAVQQVFSVADRAGSLKPDVDTTGGLGALTLVRMALRIAAAIAFKALRPGSSCRSLQDEGISDVTVVDSDHDRSFRNDG
jgi:hypothetical protein